MENIYPDQNVNISPTRVLSRDEIQAVVRGHRTWREGAKAIRPTIYQHYIIFRLSCCCGLRSKEIAGINLGDFISIDGSRPELRIRKSVTKGVLKNRRGRMIPLWWDRGTLNDLREWYHYRVRQCQQWYAEGIRCVGERDLDIGTRLPNRPFDGTPDNEPVVCTQTRGKHTILGSRLHRTQISYRWKTAISKFLPAARVKQLPCHSGRHSYITHALYGGHKAAAVRNAAGHRNLAQTSEYLHLLDGDECPDIFGFTEPLNVKRKPSKYGESGLATIEIQDNLLHRILTWVRRRGVSEDEALAEVFRVARRHEPGRVKKPRKSRKKEKAVVSDNELLLRIRAAMPKPSNPSH